MDDAPTRLAAALEGRYRLERTLGEGGMATVYLAHDVKHDRPVAIKVLRSDLAAVVGAERFLAEIRTTAKLQHPNVLPLHDSGDADGLLYYVMPYVDGESLRARLEREAQLPVAEAIEIARGVADALDYAHRQGVVHRDVKPANVLLHEGRPLVADFGIALAVQQAGERLTQTGLSVGTPHYMSPEQAAGERALDARSDVYALGCVLYEMLTGSPPFVGASAQAVLARILTAEPERVTQTRRTVPEHVDAVVAKALEKLPADRFATAAQMKTALEDPDFRYAGVGVAPPTAPSTARSIWVQARPWALALTSLGLLASLLTRPRIPPPPPPYQDIVAETTRGPLAPEVSSRGDVAFQSGLSDSLRVRRAGSTQAEALRPGVFPEFGTATFAPDGAWIAYASDGTIRKVPVEGGAPVVVASDVGRVSSLGWSADGWIYIASSSRDGGLVRVRDTGGEEPDRLLRDRPVMHVQTLPRRYWVLVFGRGEQTRFELFALHVVTGEERRVGAFRTPARWSASGHLLWREDARLFSAPFDLRALRIRGDTVPVMEAVGSFAVSEHGVLAYVHNARAVNYTLTDLTVALVAPDGAVEPTSLVLTTPTRPLRVSSDGRRIAVGSDSLPVFDLVLGATDRLAPGELASTVVWSPDGSRLAWTARSRRGEGRNVVHFSALDGSEAAPPYEDTVPAEPVDWVQGVGLVLEELHGGDDDPQTDLVILDVEGDRSVRSYLRGDHSEAALQASPDGRWAAYVSDETGAWAVYVRSFPDPGPAVRVGEPTVDAPMPRWSADGGTLYVGVHDGQQVAVVAWDVLPADGFAVANPREVARVVGPAWDVHPDGRVVGVPVSRQPAAVFEPLRLRVIVNWFTELNERMNAGS